MTLYNKTTMDHFLNPRNAGIIENASSIGELSSNQCGDIMKFYLKISKDIITDSKFETFGCPGAIASSSVATELIKGKSIQEAFNITNKDIIKALGGVPEEKVHCTVLAEKTIKDAIKNYNKKEEYGVN